MLLHVVDTVDIVKDFDQRNRAYLIHQPSFDASNMGKPNSNI